MVAVHNMSEERLSIKEFQKLDIRIGTITKVERVIAVLDAQTPGADANLDGSVDALDITKVERAVAGLD